MQSRRVPLTGLRIDTCYRSFGCRVTEQAAGRVRTTRGEFWLPADVRLRYHGDAVRVAPLSALKPGVDVDATVRFEPSTEQQLARLVVVGL